MLAQCPRNNWATLPVHATSVAFVFARKNATKVACTSRMKWSSHFLDITLAQYELRGGSPAIAGFFGRTQTFTVIDGPVRPRESLTFPPCCVISVRIVRGYVRSGFRAVFTVVPMKESVSPSDQGRLTYFCNGEGIPGTDLSWPRPPAPAFAA